MSATDDVRVLVVDDDFMVARIHTQFVERTDGFVVVGVASSGQAALDDTARLRPDLLLLDVHLPDMTGIDVLRRLRAGGDDVGVLMVTAAREADTVRAAAAGGAVHYLVKPFDYEDLQVRLESFRAAQLALSGVGCARTGRHRRGVRSGSRVPAPSATLPKGLSPRDRRGRAARTARCRRAVRGGVRGRRRHLPRLRASLPRALRHPRQPPSVRLQYGGAGRPERRYRST